ncbi:MAG: nickel pincer cofactor biosynthesis protein LarB [Spirochaetota bacterium]
MTREQIENLLEAYNKGNIDKNRLIGLLSKSDPNIKDNNSKSPEAGFTDLGHTKVDISRLDRVGLPEVIYCKNKTNQQIVDASIELYEKNGFALLTRVDQKQFSSIQKHFPQSTYHKQPGLVVIGEGLPRRGCIAVISAGTSDAPVAEEAAITAEVLGCNVKRVYDAGVSGLHRLLSCREEISSSNVIVAVAGMEGALPSVIGGIFGGPVIGVPTSVGYGTSFQGLTPLLTMLNSCAPGVCVVNIDNGFGAGYMASLINNKIEKTGKK